MNIKHDVSPGTVFGRLTVIERRDSVAVAAFGETLPLSEWSRRTGIPRRTLALRVQSGWTPERIVGQPTWPRVRLCQKGRP